MAVAVGDIQKKYERMQKLGVMFKTKPIKMGPVTVSIAGIPDVYPPSRCE
jgi:hypothetical protein